MSDKAGIVIGFILMALPGLWSMNWDAQAFFVCIGIIALFVVIGALVISKEA
jgi:hypothetical protein